MKQIATPVLFFLLFSWRLTGQVTMQKEEGGLLFLEKGEKVLFYQSEPKSYEGKYERCNYIHPLWGVDGAVLTEDFPSDHLHHRGIFWAWHQVWINGKRIGDPWEIKAFNQKVTDIEFWAQKDGSGLLKTKVEWFSDQWKKNGQKVPYMTENTTITVYPETNNYRRIDFEISLLALEKGLSIGGSEDEKGYSGFSVRMVLPDDVTFTGPNGRVQPENTAVQSPGYVNIAGSMGKNGKSAGIVMVDHSTNPGYPQPWILRAKNSMQNAAFPGNGTVPLSTSVPLVLKYSLLVYSGKMNDRKIKKAMEK
jgi:hypothetical protein